MADIVIRGMEMPKEHRTDVLIFKNGFVAYFDVKGYYLGYARATQLPEGHGRLIDADALAYSDEVKQKGCAYQEEIFAAPTIVPAEGGGEE